MGFKKKKKVLSEGETQDLLDDVAKENGVKPKEVKPKRELPSGDIKQHSKFDKFKGEQK